MNDINIRRATKQDMHVVYKFVCELENEQLPADHFTAVYNRNVDGDNIVYLLAMTGETPVGLISCHGQYLLHHCGLVYEIQELYIDPQYRKMNIGRRLMQAVEDMIAGTDYELLEVACNRKRTGAHAFYEACGFAKSHYKFTKPNAAGATAQ